VLLVIVNFNETNVLIGTVCLWGVGGRVEKSIAKPPYKEDLALLVSIVYSDPSLHLTDGD
jgi:hypothetical protein